MAAATSPKGALKIGGAGVLENMAYALICFESYSANHRQFCWQKMVEFLAYKNNSDNNSSVPIKIGNIFSRNK